MYLYNNLFVICDIVMLLSIIVYRRPPNFRRSTLEATDTAGPRCWGPGTTTPATAATATTPATPATAATWTTPATAATATTTEATDPATDTPASSETRTRTEH